ncbi:hypothetical protein D3Y57_06935 [Sphingomonas paeninsulae]|uniref:Uncharacterized protein n=2 Tax=Sphingomonas paeninsulae TaxID=2319844 RepID=A0A494TEQ1_SPHPE|nr:hypothetical protein D3Y57_06935 [Sphingomonas paeninsulae]
MPVESFDDRLAELRAHYSGAICDVMDSCIEDILLPADRMTLLADAAMFMVFIISTKIAAEQGAGADDRRALMAAYWPLEKAIKSDVPKLLMEFVDAVKAEARAPSCRVCGCTETTACVVAGKPNCHWVEPDLCSTCAEAPTVQ